MDNKDCICAICTGEKSDKDIFRLIEYYKKVVCEVCLQTVVAPASPKLFINYVNNGKILYEDLKKEQDYIESLDVVDSYFEDNDVGYAVDPDGSIIKAKGVSGKTGSFSGRGFYGTCPVMISIDGNQSQSIFDLKQDGQFMEVELWGGSGRV